MPQYLEPGARVSERWSPGRSAKVELRYFTASPPRTPMTEQRMALAELLQKSGDGDFLPSVAEAMRQILMEADVEGLIGAGRHERTIGSTIAMAIASAASTPAWARSSSGSQSCAKARTSRPSWSRARPQKGAGQVIQEAWIGGLSTRRVDELVQATGLNGISKSQVSKLRKSLPPRRRLVF